MMFALALDQKLCYVHYNGSSNVLIYENIMSPAFILI